MIEPPHLVVTEPQHYAFLRLMCPSAEIQQVMGPGIQEVYAAVAEQGVKPAGPWFTHHLARPVLHCDFEICVPVAAPFKPTGRVEAGEWPAMTVARTVYHGRYQGLPAAWGELEKFVKQQPGRPGSDIWERYLVNPNSNPEPSEWRTELNWPLLD